MADRSPLAPHAQPTLHTGLLAFASMLVFALYQMTVENSYAPMRPEMAVDLGVTPLQSGLISPAFMVGYALMQLPAGALLDRLGAARLVPLVALATGVSCAIMACSTGFASAVTGRVLMGAAASFAGPAIAAVTRLGLPVTMFAMFIGISDMSIGAGGVAGIWGGNELQAASSWRTVMWIATVAALPMAVACWWLLPKRVFGAQADGGSAGALATLKELLANRDVRVAALLYALICGTLCGFGGMWNIMLAEAWRYQESEAIIIASAFFVGIAAGSPLIGLLAKRFGSRATMLGAMWITLPAFVVWIVVPVEVSMWFDACNVAVIGAGLTGSVLAFDIACHRLPSHRVASAIAIVNLAGMAAGAVLEILPAAILRTVSDTRLHEVQMATAVFPLMILLAIVAMRLVARERQHNVLEIQPHNP